MPPPRGAWCMPPYRTPSPLSRPAAVAEDAAAPTGDALLLPPPPPPPPSLLLASFQPGARGGRSRDSLLMEDQSSQPQNQISNIERHARMSLPHTEELTWMRPGEDREGRERPRRRRRVGAAGGPAAAARPALLRRAVDVDGVSGVGAAAEGQRRSAAARRHRGGGSSREPARRRRRQRRRQRRGARVLGRREGAGRCT